MEVKEVSSMTTTKESTTSTSSLVPEVLTEEHHEGLAKSWEMPAYQREAAPKQGSRRSLVVGIVAGVTGLAVGFGAGYLIGAATAPTPEPVVVTRTVYPPALDANGMPLGKRVPPFDTMAPTDLPVQVALDANGMTLGTRVPQDL